MIQKKILWLILCTIPFLSVAQNKINAVSFNRTKCFGKCPAYRLMITDKGDVYYDGFSNAMMDGYYTGKVNPKKVQAIFLKYKNKKILTLPEKYVNKISDISQLHMTFQFKSKTKTIRHAHMGPPYLQQLAKDLDKLIKTEKIKWQPGNADSLVEIGNDEFMPDDQPIQNTTPKEASASPEVFLYVEQMPEFPGGEVAMQKYVEANIKYPQEAVAEGIEGKVYCSFVVTETGSIEHIEVRRGVHPALDKEAVRVIKEMPNWKPGKQNGKAVAVRMTVPITFYFKK